MYCKACGKEIPNDSAFCQLCGAPQSAQVPISSREDQWENCAIKSSIVKLRGILVLDWTFMFYAEAIGPNGTRRIDESSSFEATCYTDDTPAKSHAAVESLNALIQRLIASGWELLPYQGTTWYSHRFRRRIVANLSRPGDDRAAAIALLAHLQANRVVLHSPSPGVVRVTRGKLSHESEAELKRLVSQVADLLAQRNT